MTTGTSITRGQQDQIVDLCKNAGRTAAEAWLKGVELTSEDGQSVVERGNELSRAISETVTGKLAELSCGLYADEEEESSYEYPPAYGGLKPIREQVKVLAALLNLSPDTAMAFIENVLPTRTLPAGAEGWAAIPSIDAVARHFFPEVKDLALRYCRAVNLILEKIGASRKFENYRKGQIVPERLRMHARAAHAFDLLAMEQNGDILIVAVQFGKRHRGRSVRRARELMCGKEFPLGAFAVGCMLLTHPEREVVWEQLHVDCAGDEFAPGAVGAFSYAPFFNFGGGRLKFGTSFASGADPRYGSASVFLLQ